MGRLNIERQKELEPGRIAHYKKVIEKAGYEMIYEDKTTLRFIFNGATINVFPYSGWSSGKTITDCRGLRNLIKQIKK